MTSEQPKLLSPSNFKNINDLDLFANKKGLIFEIKSPRTIEACKRLGLSLSELEPVNKLECKKFYVIRDKVANPPSEFVDLRYNMLD
jgi:hypothetical protein